MDDLEEAVVFYTALFQPTAVDRTEKDVAFLEMGDQFLALFERGYGMGLGKEKTQVALDELRAKGLAD